MCEPTTMAMASFGLSTASAVAGHQQAAGQAKVQTALHKINQANSIQAMAQEQYDLGRRQQQEHEATAQNVNDANLRSLAQQSSALAMMADSGVSGLSMSNIMRDVATQAAKETGKMKTNMQWSSENLAAQRVGARNTAIMRAGQTTKGTKPSILATGLKIGSGALDAVTSYQATQ